MSRIAGVVDLEGSRDCPKIIQGMMEQMRPSIPDAVEHISGAVSAFGWRGNGQPNIYTNARLTVAFDGVIFNRSAFGDELSDSERFAVIYEKTGFHNAVQQINGDFVVALWDSREKTLWLARDRFGVKPLYYVTDPKHFAFASRPAALLAVPGASKKANPYYVARFAALHYRYIDHEKSQSPYADIHQLPAGHTLRFHNGKIEIKPYWSLREQDDFSDSEEELARRCKELLFDSINIRYKSADRPAFTLSGGMDSSSVFASTVAMTGEKQAAISAGYSDLQFDESKEIRPILENNASQWHLVQVEQFPLLKTISEIIRCHDEPVPTATWLSHYLICKTAKTLGVGSLFGGLGGDELNAGEYEHFFPFFADLSRPDNKELLDHEIELWAKHHNHPIYSKSRSVVEKKFHETIDFNIPGRCLPDRIRMLRYLPALNRGFYDLTTFEPNMEHPFQSYLKNRTYQDLTSETIPCCLRADDRNTSYWGLDHYLPFLDHRLVEFMYRVPALLKIRDGVTKRLLRTAMIGVVPDETRTRIKKTGWNAPVHLWICENLGDISDLIRSQKFRERGLYNIDVVERLLQEHVEIVRDQKPQENHMMFFWQLLNLELWFQTMVD